MSVTRHARISELVRAALERSPAERAAFLDEACDGDGELRSKVESLLTHDESTSASTGTVEIGHLLDALEGEPDEADRHIGPYRILRKLGEGGMGEVWLAEQIEPVRREVALKIVKRGMESKQHVARFEAERQALALMDHPAIAKVHDAGVTPQGRPYLVMEYVKGLPITAHCDRHRLTTRERLELFIQVCEGVQHAHQKALIHRDLKPSNVLVSLHDDRAAVRIIDFGVAKAMGQKLTDRTMHTQLGALVGTLPYMSPEQAESASTDIDTRTDVYSLGVMLYELLVGALPFAPQKMGEAELVRRIREYQPPRPSTRASAPDEQPAESAHHRRTSVLALRRELSGDLDWITLKALEKERARRYGSPRELAEDLRRYLTSKPVTARPPSTVYRARKFVWRHRVAMLVAGLFVLTLLGGIAGTSIGLLRARAAEARATEAERLALAEAEAAQQVAVFMEELFQVPDPKRSLGTQPTARELLDRGASRIERQLADQPLVQARMRAVIGRTYRALGLFDEALPFTRNALDTRIRAHGPEHLDVADSQYDLCYLLTMMNDDQNARSPCESALRTRQRLLDPAHPELAWSLNRVAALEHRARDLDTARVLYQRAMKIQEQALGPDHPDLAWTANALAHLSLIEQDMAQATELLERALRIDRQTYGDEHPRTAWTLRQLARVRFETGQLSEARALYDQVRRVQETTLGPTHPDLTGTLWMLAVIHRRQERPAAAEDYFDRAVSISEQLPGSERSWRLAYQMACYRAMGGELDKALSQLRLAVERGYSDADWMSQDPDLAALHELPEFATIVRAAREQSPG